MKPDTFIIKVPAGAENQGWASLFEPTRMQPNFPDRWSICVKPEIAVQAAGAFAQFLSEVGSKSEMIAFGSNRRPMIITSRHGRALDIMRSAKFFDDTFHNLHWIGLTPDRVIRHVEKQLLIRYVFSTHRAARSPHHFILEGVMIDADGIEESYKRLSDEVMADMTDMTSVIADE